MILRLMSARPIVAVERSLLFRLVVWRIAPRLMRVTGGRLARTLPFPADVLDARDGRPHRRVVIYFHDGDRVTVIPSKAGMSDDRFWFQNALTDPNVRFGGRAFRAAAARHDRTIPILRLTPR